MNADELDSLTERVLGAVFEVTKASFGGIRAELARLDIHRASMFPDLGGLGRHVEWLHIKNEDE